jgi:hypothetical protein
MENNDLLEKLEDVTFETKLYTSIWEFIAPMSYKEVLENIKDWILELKRYEIRSRQVWDLYIQSKAVVNVILDTNKTPILCYEEAEMTDVKKEEINKKSKS